MKLELTYEEITEQATKTITEFMEQTKSADSRYSADFLSRGMGGKNVMAELNSPSKE
ncbi:TPA: hypothetical protein M2F29_003888 [Escherichia coli]|uniref:hypothetical protein n=1 Tax=Escherichia coli TaxID=562 RepID=UPI0006A05EA5|nr:hypothetical protein [Escherichia coli]EKD3776609.1 hypothetical protein [Shigella flexneri]HDQ6516641.1 hypothetical protein [Escherichia coli O22:H16]EER3038792.1 hypothetical protein [Escherichia coli]EER3702245.1 hypothetical protein [Escherichia coli]EET1193724.1 hypothetical protein [Escherichia coli]